LRRILCVPTRGTALPAPMYATLGHELPRGPGWTFEPKYDGMRVLADASSRRVRLVTRNGKDKSAQFPEVVAALRALVIRAGRAFTLDGEVVARRRRAARGATATSEFQQLQARMHLRDAPEVARLAMEAPATLVVFDILRDGRSTLIGRTWIERRERLEALMASTGEMPDAALTLSATSVRGATMLARARRVGWEGIIAKRIHARYQPGARSDDWLKLKLQFRAEFVVGGYTEPRNTREHIGALLVGYYDDGKLIYAGHVGTGFTDKLLAELQKEMAPLTRPDSPFATPVPRLKNATFVEPKLVGEVQFSEWTRDGTLRQPSFKGLREDKDPRKVVREEPPQQ
jgi:bifunctional non-homologous end joining protein LigD